MLRLIWRLTKIFTILAILGAAGLYAIFQYYTFDLPSYEQLANYNPPAVTRIYTADGKLLEEYAKENRVFVPIENIPTSLIRAFISAEDKNFYQHPGLDLNGLLRAIINNTANLVRNKRMEGGSTITQQVVKIFILGPERSLSRKIKEAILSFKITQVYSKDKILELYLNQAFLGMGTYGVATASKRYFNKSLEDLDLAESALLASLPKFPSILNSSANYDKAKARRDYVIYRMLDDGYIGQDAAQKAIATPIKITKPVKEDRFEAGYYAENVRSQVIKMIGEEEFYTGGLTIITPLNSSYQKSLAKAFTTGIRTYDEKYGYKGPIAKLNSLDNWKQDLSKYINEPRLLEYEPAVVLGLLKDKVQIGLVNGEKDIVTLAQMKWAKSNLKSPQEILKVGDIIAVLKVDQGYGLKQIPKVDGAAIIMDVLDGRVLAMVSGYDYRGSKFDRATQAQRQPGSLIKPFIYLSALEHNISPDTIFEDKPIEIYQGPGLPIYKPKNFKGDYLGPITMRSALELSRNTVTVQIAKMVGLGSVAEIIKRYGINQNPKKFYSMALGSLETTLDKITSAYGSIANGCHKISPHFIEMIKDRNGKIIYRRDQRTCLANCSANRANEDQLPTISKANLYSPLSDQRSCHYITSMLQGVVENGTARSAQKLGKAIAGKTGTSNDSKDTWFVGFTPKIVVGTYVGYDQPKDMGKRATGATVTLPIFVKLMQDPIFASQPNLQFPQAANLAPFNQEGQNNEPALIDPFEKMQQEQSNPLPDVDVY